MPTNPTINEPGKPQRRWLQFRLRTLLIGVMLLSIPCGYVGWQAKIVHHREWVYENLVSGHAMHGRFENDTFRSFSFVRKWMGDEPLSWVLADNGASRLSPETLAKIKDAFPEAEIDWPSQGP